MPLNMTSRKFIENMISRKEPFRRASMSGVWVKPNEYSTDDKAGELPSVFFKTLKEHNVNTDLFVVYSYATPLAWFSLKDSDSSGTGKWYFPETYYSNTSSQHQGIIRTTLRGEDVEKLYGDE